MFRPVDRQQQLENRLGAALYRVACLKQQMSDPRSQSRLGSKLLQEVERLAGELEQTFRELAESREAFQAARSDADAAESRARLLFQTCPVACVIAAADGTIVEANPAAAALLNVSARHLAGKPLHLFVNGQRTEFMDHFAALGPDRPGRWSGRLQPRERSIVHVDVVGALDASGERILLLTGSREQQPRQPKQDLHPDAEAERTLELRNS
jgi:PAS domain-containing protein